MTYVPSACVDRVSVYVMLYPALRTDDEEAREVSHVFVVDFYVRKIALWKIAETDIVGSTKCVYTI